MVQMKAIIATADQDTEITEKEIRPLKSGEALLKMICCGVCHTDLHVKNADFGDVSGRVLGHEGIGEVIEVADDVTSLAIGDRSSVAWFLKAAVIVSIVPLGERPYVEKLRILVIQWTVAWQSIV